MEVLMFSANPLSVPGKGALLTLVILAGVCLTIMVVAVQKTPTVHDARARLSAPVGPVSPARF
jgi:hypothetical protein